MSVINQMLKDLEQRNASASEIKPLAGDVRPVRVVSGRTMSISSALLIIAVLVLAGAGFWWKLHANSAQNFAAEGSPSLRAPVIPKPVAEAPSPVRIEEVAPSPVPESSVRLPGLDTELRTMPILQSAPEKKEKETVSASATDAAPDVTHNPPVTDSRPREIRLGKIFSATTGTSLKSVTPVQKSENLYKQAVTMLQQGRVSETRGALEQALLDNPANHNARQLLVSLLVENKHSTEALTLLQEGVRIAPDQTGFVIALARLQVEAGGDRGAALQTMEQGAQYVTEDAEFHGFYAALLQREERHQEAVSHYLKALNDDPANTSWLVGVGISLQAQEKYGDAREAFERARQSSQLSQEMASFVDQRLRQLKGK